MTLHLSIPPLPDPPHQYGASLDASSAGRTYHHQNSWVPAPPPTSLQTDEPPPEHVKTYTPVVDPGFLIPRLPMSGPYPSPPAPQAPQAHRKWKNYMMSIGTNFDRLDVTDKPLPPVPNSSSLPQRPSPPRRKQPQADLPPSNTSSSYTASSYTSSSSSGHLSGSAGYPSGGGYGSSAPPSAYQQPPSYSQPPPVPPRPPRLSSVATGPPAPATAPLPGRPRPSVSNASASSSARVASAPVGLTVPPSLSPTKKVSPSRPAKGLVRMSQPKLTAFANPIAPVVPKVSPVTPKKQRSQSATPAAGAIIVDLTADSDDSYLPSDDDDSPPPRRSGQQRRAVSAEPRLQAAAKAKATPSASATSTPKTRRAPASASKIPRTPKTAASTPSKASSARSSTATATDPPAVRCAGFTRNGNQCKRLVKSAAPFLASRDPNVDDDDAERVIGRYCKDHAGLVCFPAGFYWRDARGKAGIWIDFADYIPSDLGQQTQTLMRMTMESPLTAKELPGFLYAYELRDLADTSTSYFKVGRTDNVPRRIGQWSNQCTSHTPTLRDIFPLKAPPSITAIPGGAGLHRQPSVAGSLLPGAVKAGVDNRRMVPAVKRWERLVHLELADRAAAQKSTEYDAILKPCTDCGAIHREIFPLEDARGLSTYEEIVVDAIGRWERFIRVICD